MSKLCIVVPYRDREEHLNLFLPHMKSVLDSQEIEFEILIVEQTFDKPFNRAKLLNIGYDLCKDTCDYVCFHDVDMLPILSDYSIVDAPTHLAAEVEQFGWGLAYQTYFGGVTMFDKKSFEIINGYSNEYFSWGCEDDGAYNRCIKMGIFPKRKNCRFRSLAHDRKIDEILYPKNVEYLNTKEISRMHEDGLSSLEYKILEEKSLTDFAKMITVEL